MKWVAVASFFVCFATLSRASGPSCEPGSEDGHCLSENTEKVPNSTESSSIVRERKKEGLAECLAGSEWASKCHICRCSKEGHAKCTRMEICLKGDYGDPIRCKPRTTFKVDCNTCTCTETGEAACTLIACISGLPLLPALPDLPATSDLPALPDLPAPSELPTISDSPALPDLPAPSELPAISDLPALEELPVLSALPAPNTTHSLWTGKRKDCLPGSRWKSKCNHCFCTEDGLPACTEMACDDREEEPERSCAPGSRWKNDCNSCWCDSGYAACTRMGCNIAIIKDFKPIGAPSSSEQAQPAINHISRTHGHRVIRRAAICKPNAAFKVYCNDCECASDGQSYTCTNYECMERDVNDDVEVFMESEGADHIERHSVCKPRGTFYIGCNTCHCSADGMDFSCTNKPCPLPKDVEIFHELRDLQPIVP